MPQLKNKPIAVLGAGAWGTALAVCLARKHSTVYLWDIDAQNVNAMVSSRYNTRYLPEALLPDAIHLKTELSEALTDVRDILIVVPSHAFRSLLNTLQPLIPKDARIAWATKGFDDDSARLLSDIAREVLSADVPLAVLSGPSFAAEMAAGHPTAVSLACEDDAFAQALHERFTQPNFLLARGTDLVGVQVCGAVKNVIALAVGIVSGLGHGANTQCALVVRGMHEMRALGVALGAQQDTFLSYAGLGDLMLTCTDNQSRNRRFGMALGRGEKAESALSALGQVVEGRLNAKTVATLSRRLNLTLPLLSQVDYILSNKAPVTSLLDIAFSELSSSLASV